MTYREAYMKCNTLSELETMVKKDIVAVKLLGSSDRIKVIKDTAEEVANLKFKENENEKYIEIIKSLDCENITSITCDYKKTGCSDCDFMLAKNKAIKALEEIQQYRAFGTVEGFERAIQSSIENYNLYREYKAKVREFETIGTIEEFKALKEKKHIGSENKEGYKHGYSDGYAKGIDDLVNGLLNWKSQDEEYKSFSDVCNEIAERLKGADMITPVRTLKVGVLCERKDDLLVSDSDIKEMARNVRNKAIDETIEKMKNWVRENNGLSILDIREIDEIAEKLKKGGVNNA